MFKHVFKENLNGNLFNKLINKTSARRINKAFVTLIKILEFKRNCKLKKSNLLYKQVRFCIMYL
ncbi:hypothetical protein GCM10011506_17890 [Marivirga lumbricoides]|uniref:Transposase n=1 Tax=Marivirga lumbricoides TaxID=1046115 RepID=A0ABQ1M048_9BACT|nr:hypothetical protein GCM10011506_17890 [Marivirga lumbricoides]